MRQANYLNGKMQDKEECKMPTDFWNYPFNPITGMFSTNKSNGSKTRIAYTKYKKETE